jgi:hypothetical protein
MEAEEYICDRVISNEHYELTEEVNETIAWVIEHAIEGVGHPLDEDQVKVPEIVFSNHISIVAGPPGAGKTAAMAAITAMATMLAPPGSTQYKVSLWLIEPP